ncbi:5'-deoxyadenosine deaminase [Persicimonas caeni]|uniref:5'-deoxyadenosine deaminase n=2 Tax=Persicimonas caeni TaxID=2292766 RepID=A0A4Y6Q366_PERCE|nr:5'-deoxyadenosine deaminase [Persicimonas caeni]QED36112.1 5'-deoxyadenosine deaminase [Persicimonas caeni]
MNDAFDVIEGDVLIRDGNIEAVGQVDVQQADGAEVVDVGGQALIPGFVQTHIHLCQTLMRNLADDMVLIDWLRKRIWPYEAALEPDELYASAELGLAELVLGGTTTLLDMGTVRHTDAVGEAVKASGIRAFIGKCMMDHGDQVPGPLLEDSKESLRESLALAERWDGAAEGRIRYAFAPRFAVSCTRGLLESVVEAANDLDLHIHTHSSETEFENEFTHKHYGVSNIEFLEQIGMTRPKSVFAHGVHVSDHECQVLAHTGSAVSHCPSSNLKLASGIANMPRYDKYGVQVSLGADGAPCNNNLDAFVEMRLAALIQKPIHGPRAMPARRVLELATIDGARALHIDDKVGSIEVGKSADLVVVDLDADPGCGPGGDVYSRLVYSAHRSNVRHVFASGRQVVRNGELAGVDLDRVLDTAAGAQRAVVERMEEI